MRDDGAPVATAGYAHIDAQAGIWAYDYTTP